MPRKHRAEPRSGYTILLVDDNAEYLALTRALLEDEGHQVVCAVDGPEALERIQAQHIDLLLLDYFMPGMTGEEVVARLRPFDPYVQVILQTGYASEQPPREMLRRLNIQGYYDKSEGPDKLLLWVDVGLKVAYTVQLLNKSRQGLRYILNATSALHKIQPLHELLTGILWQLSGLLGAGNSFLAVLPGPAKTLPENTTEAFVAMLDEEDGLMIRAGLGRFSEEQPVESVLEPEKTVMLQHAMQTGEITVENGITIVPLQVGDRTLGAIYLDRPAVREQDLELVQIFANQAAVAIQNAQLFEMATLDRLTGVYMRRFYEQALLRELRTAFRTHQPLALIMLDLDNLKALNDTAGHLAGDQALTTVARALQQATRSTDIVARYGGDEFAIVLPQTDLSCGEGIGHRFLELIADTSIPGPAGRLPVQCSLGVAALEPRPAAADEPRPSLPADYFPRMANVLLSQADGALYAAKQNGKHQMTRADSVTWVSPTV